MSDDHNKTDEVPNPTSTKSCAVGYTQAAQRHSCPFDAFEHFKADDLRWCSLHLPTSQRDGSPTEKATWTPEQTKRFVMDPILNILRTPHDIGPTIDLSFAEFSGMIQFTTMIPCLIIFDYAIFHGPTFFKMPNSQMSFRGTTFKERVDFRQTTFADDAIFWNATFENTSQFTGVEFSGQLQLKGAKFKKRADFTNAVFGGLVNIDNVTYEDDAIFVAAGAKEPKLGIVTLLARKTMFKAEAQFTNRDFWGTTNFEGATFSKAPDFHGCVLHQATYFPPMANFFDVSSLRAASCYRTLFRAMGDVRAHDEEAMFFALQQATARRNMAWRDPVRIVSWVYDKASDYGQSIQRPLVLFVATQAIFALAYFILAAHYHESTSDIVGATLGFCGQQIFRPFSVWFDSADKWPRQVIASSRAPWPFVLGTLQTLLSAMWIYFLALGTRWRFRRW